MADDFFKKKEEPEQPMSEPKAEPEVDKVKVGEKEYTQEELSSLVGLGETAKQYETQWNRKIEQFYPDYTQKSQKLAEFEKTEEERQKAELERKQVEGSLSPEEAKRVALEQARELGIVTKDEFNQEVKRVVSETLTAKDLLDDAGAVIAEAGEKGQPKTSVPDLLRYMSGENSTKTQYSNPEKAYKDMFEPEIDKWKEEQLNAIKPAGMETQEGSTAGSKTPPSPSTITRDTLSAAIQESLTRGRGA